MVDQESISAWEKENFNNIWGWEIHYGVTSDKIIFKMVDKTTMTFERIKNVL